MQRVLVVLFTMLVMACLSNRHKPLAPPNVSALESVSVTLVLDDGLPSCGGTWISPTTVITAAHCVAPRDVGAKVSYQTKAMTQNATAVIIAIGEEGKVDLAALFDPVPPPHLVARLSDFDADVGETLDVMGSPNRIPWVHLRGPVVGASLLKHDGLLEGPLLEVRSDKITGGSSGGGAFNEAGELVGVCVRKNDTEKLGFFVQASVIRRFLHNT